MESLDLYRRNFHLEDGCVIRTRTGKSVEGAKPNKLGYQYVNVEGVPHLLHRIKYGLTEGHLPKEIDHRNRNPSENDMGNLRPADRSQQMHNRGPRRRLGGVLPRGVYAPLGKRKKYAARVTVGGRRVNLGWWETAGEASEAVEAMLKVIYGEYYAEH